MSTAFAPPPLDSWEPTPGSFVPPSLSKWEDPQQPHEVHEPLDPSDVQRVTASTPRPPTAATQTAPEHPDTIAVQLQQLGQRMRKVVMMPKGTPPPPRYPPGIAITSDSYGNVYAYDPGQIKKSAIHSAARRNKLPEILGSTQLGMGSPDKSALPPDAPVVTAHTTEGIEIQSTATDAASLPYTLQATQAVTPPGGRVSVVSPRQALHGRLYQGAPPVAPVADFSAPSGF